MDALRIALVTSCCPVGANQDNIDGMIPFIAEARHKGVHVICFPEMNITGFSVKDQIRDAAEPIPGPASDALQQVAQEHQLIILAGLAERGANKQIFASHLVISPHQPLGVYRKLHIAPPEKGIFMPGNRIPLFEAHGFTYGIQLCYDSHFPDITTRMALAGADLILIPHASPRGRPDKKLRSWMRHLTARAFDNSLYVGACNQSGANHTGMSFPGIALAINPSGELISSDTGDTETILVFDVQRKELDHVRQHRMRYLLPQRRSEIYSI